MPFLLDLRELLARHPDLDADGICELIALHYGGCRV